MLNPQLRFCSLGICQLRVQVGIHLLREILCHLFRLIKGLKARLVSARVQSSDHHLVVGLLLLHLLLHVHVGFVGELAPLQPDCFVLGVFGFLLVQQLLKVLDLLM